MFRNDYELIPLTYSIKSYRKKSGFGLKKFVLYTVYGVLIAAILSITLLSIFHLV